MDELVNCKICGKLFQSNTLARVCQNCAEQDEKNYKILRDYLVEHPKASIYEVATNLDISINKIKFYLKEGRIEIVEKDNQFLLCEMCKRPIHSGRCCDECLNKHSTHDYKSAFVGNSNPKSNSKSSSDKKSATKINYGAKR